MGVPEIIRWVLWDLDVETLETDRDADSILPRVLENGRLADARALFDLYGEERVRRFLRDVGHPLITRRTQQFWRCYFRAEDEEWAEPRSPSNSVAPFIG